MAPALVPIMESKDSKQNAESKATLANEHRSTRW